MKTDPIVEMFENKIAEYTGAPYAVAVSSNTNGIFLVLEAMKYFGDIEPGATLTIPKQTYYSVGMSILNAGFKVDFEDAYWGGFYRIKPLHLYDSALYIKKDMYGGGESDSWCGPIFVLSTQYRKSIPIGRGGVILTRNPKYAEYLRKIRINGDENIRGWNMYMTPEQAARGLSLMERLKDGNIGSYEDYPDISGWAVWRH